jgi:hypothetical protein
MKLFFPLAGLVLTLCGLAAMLVRDWPRLRLAHRRVEAEIVDHVQTQAEDGVSHHAVYAFVSEDARHEVVDDVGFATPRPAKGTKIILAHPVGLPDLARPPRPFFWLFVYGIMVMLIALTSAHIIERMS